jgi:hypothetical protein
MIGKRHLLPIILVLLLIEECILVFVMPLLPFQRRMNVVCTYYCEKIYG